MEGSQGTPLAKSVFHSPIHRLSNPREHGHSHTSHQYGFLYMGCFFSCLFCARCFCASIVCLRFPYASFFFRRLPARLRRPSAAARASAWNEGSANTRPNQSSMSVPSGCRVS